MSDTVIIELALRTMLVALKLSAPDPAHLPGHRLHGLAVPVDDPDPGVHPRLRAQADRRRPGAAAVRQLDAAHAGHLHRPTCSRPCRPCSADSGAETDDDAHGRRARPWWPTCSPRSGSWPGWRWSRRSPGARCRRWPRWSSPWASPSPSCRPRTGSRSTPSGLLLNVGHPGARRPRDGLRHPPAAGRDRGRRQPGRRLRRLLAGPGLRPAVDELQHRLRHASTR